MGQSKSGNTNSFGSFGALKQALDLAKPVQSAGGTQGVEDSTKEEVAATLDNLDPAYGVIFSKLTIDVLEITGMDERTLTVTAKNVFTGALETWQFDDAKEFDKCYPGKRIMMKKRENSSLSTLDCAFYMKKVDELYQKEQERKKFNNELLEGAKMQNDKASYQKFLLQHQGKFATLTFDDINEGDVLIGKVENVKENQLGYDCVVRFNNRAFTSVVIRDGEASRFGFRIPGLQPGRFDWVEDKDAVFTEGDLALVKVINKRNDNGRRSMLADFAKRNNY